MCQCRIRGISAVSAPAIVWQFAQPCTIDTHTHTKMYRGERKAYVRNVSSSEANLHTSCSPSPALLPPPAPLSFPQQEIPPKLPFSVAISKPFVENNFPPDIILLYILFMMTAQCFKKYKFIISIFGSWSNISSLQYR